jgi:predicted TIM-barrel fold metal-dependent hydrolase
MVIAAGSVNPVTRTPPSARTGAEQMRASLEEMRRFNVVRGYVSAVEGYGPEVVLPWREADPGRVVAAAALEVLRPPEDAGAPPAATSAAVRLADPDLLRRRFEDASFGMLGEIGAQYAGLSLSDPRFEPYLALAEELDVPVGVHTGIGFAGVSYDPCCRNFRTAYGNPQTVEEVLNRHPRLRLYLMHGGWPYAEETIAMMSVYPQLYADLAVIDWIIPRAEFHGHLQRLMRAGLGDRLMFGSDQMRWPEAIGMAIEGVESAPFLSAAEKRAIFCGNAARFFRLEGPQDPCRAR